MAIHFRSYAFRREREGSWRDLDRLLDKLERNGIKGLTAAELARLTVLYRATVASLSVARSISLDKNALDYLESLTARGYLAVYGTRRHVLEATADFFVRRFPRAFRACFAPFSLATVMLLAGIAVGGFATLQDMDRYFAFVSTQMVQGRTPFTSTESLREVLYSKDDASSLLGTFAMFLFTHNAKIGILAFALGFAAGVPVILLMFGNGLMLGAMGALYHSRGLSLDFWGWILPHGVTELLAVVLCGGGGLVLAQSIVFPGRSTRWRSLSERGKTAGTLAFGAVFLFFIAGLIEGIFRQVVHSVPIRYAVAASTFLFWVLYFAFAGRKTR